MAELIKIKKIKGKQNKKKWSKNIDVSGLLQKIEEQHNQQFRNLHQTELIVEDTTLNKRAPLNPNRFKQMQRSYPKPKYDNKIKKQSLLNDAVDAWNNKNQDIVKKVSQPTIIPAIVKPLSGHSYHPTQQHLQDIKNTIVERQGRIPIKIKKIKKNIIKKIVPRARNKKMRAQQLQARARRQQRALKNQLNSSKKIRRQLEQEQKKIQATKQERKQKLIKIKQDNRTGRVYQGPKLGKKRYQYQQFLPNSDQLGKPISKVHGNGQLMKDRFDSIYRRGLMEPRNIKVHANRKKHIKVIQRFRQ